MKKCDDCKYFDPFSDTNEKGICTITLPPWVQLTVENINLYDRVVYKESGCDLFVQQETTNETPIN